MKPISLLKEISSWHKPIGMELSQLNIQLNDAPFDRQALNQAIQAVITHGVTLQICHDRRIQLHSALSQTELSANAVLLPLVTQRLSLLKQTCLISALPIELLGQLHEQFLVKHHTATRKAQGIYYTPVSIVNYIVNSTLESQLQNKTIEDLHHDRIPLRILDPACGSGAFLLGAYQYLLNWYHSQYLATGQYSEQLCQHNNGAWYLTIAAKRQILLRHIFGLDINRDAVEVTKRSLLLQMLEGSLEEKQTYPCRSGYPSNLELLQFNIQCGNALIDLDFYQLDPQIQFTPELADQINAFSWEIAFPKIIQSGGFEIVIGNPPWVFTRNAKFDTQIKQYYRSKYFLRSEPVHRSKARQTGKLNLFILFLLKCIELIHKDGLVGIVVPNTLLRTTVYETARKYILDHCNIEQIVDLGNAAFSGVTASSTILMLGRKPEKSTVKLINTTQANKIANTLKKSDFLQNTSYVFSIFLDKQQSSLFQKMNVISIPLKDLVAEIIEGIVCRKDQIKRHQADDRYQRILEGKDIDRYCISFREKYILFDRSRLHRPRPNYVWNAKEKLILRRIAGGEFALVAALDTECYYAFASTNNILLRGDHRYNIRYVLALLNSRLLNCYYIQKFTNQSSLTVNISKTFLEQLPIRSINFDCSFEKLQHDRLVAQVEQLQALHRQLHAAQTLAGRQTLQQHIQAIDQQIDQGVYELYNLTDPEIELIRTPTVRSLSQQIDSQNSAL